MPMFGPILFLKESFSTIQPRHKNNVISKPKPFFLFFNYIFLKKINHNFKTHFLTKMSLNIMVLSYLSNG